MRHIRAHIAWLLLCLTVVLALPRTWVHDCVDEVLQEQADLHMHDGPAIDHARCAVCDYAPVVAGVPTLVLALEAPASVALAALPPDEPLVPAPHLCTSLRGPPMA